MLHQNRSGLTAAALPESSKRGNPDGLANVRTLMWGLRNKMGELFESEPYWFGEQLTVELVPESADA